jgi:flagellar basal-body rod protein FlgF
MTTSAVHVGLSAQITMERRMATIADNVANANTPGFRAAGVKFESVMSRVGSEEVAFASQGEAYISRRAGPVKPTGNPLDVAVEGKGWLAIGTPDGPAYTRDGRLRLGPSGRLETVTGLPVLDPGGAPVTLDPQAGAVTIADDGTISQGDNTAGAIGIFELPETSELTRTGNSAVYSSMPAVPIEDPTTKGVRQGYLEGANVDPMIEMVRLIEVTRAFESAMDAAQRSEDALRETAKALGPT